MTELQRVAEYLVEKGKKRGADQAEVFIKSGEQTTVKVFRNEVELFTKAGSCGAGIRVFKDGKLGYAYSTMLERQALDNLVDAALENSGFSQADRYMGLPETVLSEKDTRATSLLAPGFDRISSAEKIDFATTMEKTALEADKAVILCEDTLYTDGKEHVLLLNSNGFSGEYVNGACFAYTSVLAGKNDDVMSGFAIRSGRAMTELDPLEIGAEAAQQAVMLLGAESVKPQRTTVVFDPVVFVEIMMSMSPAFSAEAVQKGRSFLAGHRGKQVAAGHVSIIDDGRMPGGLGTTPFDDEGVKTQQTTLIERGVLSGLLYNSYSARKDKARSTGNASRVSYKTPPGTSPTNLFIEPGATSKEDVIRDVSEGVYVISVQGLHAGVNAVTGQFSVGAGGMLIKDGLLDRPVREITIASTLPDLLKNITVIGDDLTFLSMGINIGSPTVAIEGIMVGGR
jgi:PmbA protein